MLLFILFTQGEKWDVVLDQFNAIEPCGYVSARKHKFDRLYIREQSQPTSLDCSLQEFHYFRKLPIWAPATPEARIVTSPSVNNE
jgi:hypothetical protein